MHGREPVGGRVFPNEIDNENNTVEGCLNQCAKFGYPAAGMEFGSQCCKRRLLTGSLSATDTRSLQSVATLPLISTPPTMNRIATCPAQVTSFICAEDRVCCRLVVSLNLIDFILTQFDGVVLHLEW